jgi:hypothetical protein
MATRAEIWRRVPKKDSIITEKPEIPAANYTIFKPAEPEQMWILGFAPVQEGDCDHWFRSGQMDHH